MFKKATKILIFILTLLLVLSFLFYKGYLRLNYPSHEEFTIRGIDISHHQGIINWEELNDDKIDFIFIKATEGRNNKDSMFADNWSNAKKYNYYVGAYHFYSFCKNGYEQAANFIKTVPNNKDNLPPVVDLEFFGNCNLTKPKKQLLREIQNCLDLLEDHYNQTPILYTNHKFYNEYINTRFVKYPVWITDIFTRPKLIDNKKWTFWQYSHRGNVAGIDTYVDLNVFDGNIEDLNKLK